MTWRELAEAEDDRPRLPELLPGTTRRTTKAHVWPRAFAMFVGPAAARLYRVKLKDVALEFGINIHSLTTRAREEEWPAYRRAMDARRRALWNAGWTPEVGPRPGDELSSLLRAHRDELDRRALEDLEFVKAKLAILYAWRGRRAPAYLNLPKALERSGMSAA